MLSMLKVDITHLAAILRTTLTGRPQESNMSDTSTFNSTMCCAAGVCQRHNVHAGACFCASREVDWAQ